MHFGCQKGYLTFQFKGKSLQISFSEIACVLAGILLFGISWAVRQEDPIRMGYVARKEYGKGQEELKLVVKGAGEEEIQMEIPVAERQYTLKEEETVMDDLVNRLEEMILGDNEDLLHIQSPLFLIKEPSTGFSIQWSSDRPDLLDDTGKILLQAGEGQQEGIPVQLKGKIRGPSGTVRETEFALKVYLPVQTEAEKAREELSRQIRQAETDSRTQEGFYLPETLGDAKLSYRKAEDGGQFWILAMGPLAAVYLRARRADQKKKEQKVRERQLLLDYSEVVSKLQIFLGAGMTVSSAWEKMVLDYLERRKRGDAVRPAYEEMAQTYYQMKSGTPEGRAYEEFGRRCLLPPYLKLAGLLEQNRRTGAKNLRQLLILEVTDAFEQRKNLARRQGEEASAKLLLPLFMMLGVVMVMVMVPAFLSFS